jgi:hypothetical protein
MAKIQGVNLENELQLQHQAGMSSPWFEGVECRFTLLSQAPEKSIYA